MSNHLVLVDGNNLGFAAMANPKLSTGDKFTQGTFTFIKKVRQIFVDYPDALIMVLWDGRSWRNDIYAEYKDKRQSNEKQQVAREEYYDQKGDMQAALRHLGVTQCFSINMEADDLAEIYSRKWTGDKVTLISGDGDWIQLVDKRVTWYDPIRERKVTLENFQDFTGYKDAAQFVEAKSILGDKDEVPGIKGIGPGKLEPIYKQFKMSFREFLDWSLAWPEEAEKQWREHTGKALPKILKDVANPNTFVQLAENDKLGDLRTPHRPEPINLERKQKPLDVEAFTDLCYKLAFLSITRRIDQFIKPFKDNKYVK
jgi:5'-3' exonuclease